MGGVPKEPVKKEDEPGPFGMLVFGAVFGVAGIAMTYNLVIGQSEFVHGPRTRHWLVTLLGEHTFSVIAAVVCLLLGALGIVVGIATLAKGGDGDEPRERRPRRKR